ncbi:polyprotein [Gossypium australe]|uniref:Polyprotein n=1 Tax=Gossypium australe TaxID=47621 RepID=A0A5B6V0S7_9ROSI|nr:polyprotein [Gossypium australe]
MQWFVLVLIFHIVSVVSRYMAKPNKLHWEVVKWILRYLRRTSNYARDLDKKRLLTGYLFTFKNCTISWKATLQAIVALSTTEAKYMAITKAVKECHTSHEKPDASRKNKTYRYSVPFFSGSDCSIRCSDSQNQHRE